MLSLHDALPIRPRCRKLASSPATPVKSNARKSASARHVGASSSASANVPQKGRESGLFVLGHGADARHEAIQSFFVLRKHHTMAHASNSRIKVGIVGGTGYTDRKSVV